MSEVLVSIPSIALSPGIGAEPSSGDCALVDTTDTGLRINFASIVADPASGGKLKIVRHGLDEAARAIFLADEDGLIVVE